MKQLTCEMCGSTDMLKQDGVFVCQSCGCKYSVEEAKKMMVEGTVEIQGTIQVDNSEKIRNYLELAREAKDENDSASAVKYYRLILEEYPNNWEARFYSTYYKARQSSLRDIVSMLKKLENSADSVLTAIKTDEHTDDQTEYVLEVATKILELAVMVHSSEMEESGSASADFLFAWGDKLEEYFPNNSEITDQASLFWETAINIAYDHFFTGGAEFEEIVSRYVEKIKKYNPDYVKPQSKATVHTSDSPNYASVNILKIGHKDFQVLPFVHVPVEYIAPGADSAGGVSVQLRLNNEKGKTINYATLYVTAYNQLGDPAACTIHNDATRGLSITGPIEAGKNSGDLIFEQVWYNPTITSVKLSSMVIEYTDGTKELYKYSKHYADGASLKIRKITISRKKAFAGCARKVYIFKENEEMFALKSGESSSFVTDDQPFEIRMYFSTKQSPLLHSLMIEAGENDLNYEIAFKEWNGRLQSKRL